MTPNKLHNLFINIFYKIVGNWKNGRDKDQFREC